MLFDLLNQKVELAAHTKPTPRRGLKLLGENCSEGIWDKKNKSVQLYDTDGRRTSGQKIMDAGRMWWCQLYVIHAFVWRLLRAKGAGGCASLYLGYYKLADAVPE